MMELYIRPDYEVVRNEARCIACRVCERQCANEVHSFDPETGLMKADESKCVNCHRCVSLCPTHALKIVKTDDTYRENANWDAQTINEVYRQANTGGVLLSSMGNPKPYPVFWDKLLINASQVTNPPIDPLREPMETQLYLGKRTAKVERDENGLLKDTLPPQLKLSVPVLFSAMSYGSICYNAHESLARAAEELGTYYNTGEGGLHKDFYKYGKNTIVQVASGRFGVHKEYLETAAAIEIKMGQGAKPGIGGHLPGGEDQRGRLRDAHDPAGRGRHLPRAAPRHLFHRGLEAARRFPQRGDGIQKADHRQDRGGAQRGGDRERHRAERGGHHRHRRLPRRHGRGAHPHPRQRGHPHRTGARPDRHAPARRGHPRRGLASSSAAPCARARTWSRRSRWARTPATSARRRFWRSAATSAAPATRASATGASPPSGPTSSSGSTPTSAISGSSTSSPHGSMRSRR